MKASELINDAYRFGNVIAEEGQDLTAIQLADGIRLLNYVVNKINIDGEEVSLNARGDITVNAGQNVVLLTDYIKVTKAQYNLGDVFLDIHLLSYDDFYNESRIVNVSSIPYSGYTRRVPEGVELNLYFTPEKDYQVRIVGGLKKIKTLSADDELEATEQFYFELLMWELSRYLRLRNQMPSDPDIKKEIIEIREKLKSIKPKNINVNLNRVGSGNLSPRIEAANTIARANIIGGWRP